MPKNPKKRVVRVILQDTDGFLEKIFDVGSRIKTDTIRIPFGRGERNFRLFDYRKNRPVFRELHLPIQKKK